MSVQVANSNKSQHARLLLPSSGLPFPVPSSQPARRLGRSLCHVPDIPLGPEIRRVRDTYVRVLRLAGCLCNSSVVNTIIGDDGA